jgi:hypothetical protein
VIRDSCPKVSRLRPKHMALLLKINSVRSMITNKLKKRVYNSRNVVDLKYTFNNGQCERDKLIL